MSHSRMRASSYQAKRRCVLSDGSERRTGRSDAGQSKDGRYQRSQVRRSEI